MLLPPAECREWSRVARSGAKSSPTGVVTRHRKRSDSKSPGPGNALSIIFTFQRSIGAVHTLHVYLHLLHECRISKLEKACSHFFVGLLVAEFAERFLHPLGSKVLSFFLPWAAQITQSVNHSSVRNVGSASAVASRVSLQTAHLLPCLAIISAAWSVENSRSLSRLMPGITL